jgi:hypothetical protein
VQAAPAAGLSFHALLSELNPLQYIPVVGTIYRAVTGDTVPEQVRMAGSLVVSGLVSGPIGVATSVAALAVEKVTGIDPEQIGRDVLADIGIGRAPKATAPASVVVLGTRAVPGVPQAAAWSAAQLAAYGVTRSAAGTLRRGDVSGSDVLNELELARHAAPAPDFLVAATRSAARG